MSKRYIHHGYAFTDITSQTDDGRYRARVAIMALDAGRTRSQRFLDLETFANEADARCRAISAAEAWIEAESGQDRLALPTNFSPL